ncbi:MAG: hypothetical protein A3B91_03725 [Candidatus Yanofskybacteria bacterium RIFCSPHIGHO2_02_FULL_41_29]|uniref:Uncharacterized protein n=1 Tax=Candidatus Yanofskybacteria bacterium RIFCSPHIGHO2_01_FULL_41_53 TaxID=1802663 RepID=A0A1F8EKP1_9BACT|nr:MAG: hypothetical protein A2650_00620 [Candidatus Yanofskybacteria bacterium RIFCSPHIGHO2_01_FULL_41_53]OGN10867.1 MAG: hypothetical protein A3B91_03725 [Candidatus Yanofskybacteria bacterium RIFCSPHIGHO2_02_FULL_41_29]OGN17862.1 MAG: hypothetical protein A3F48_03410 [Candidatus Yanofskybacteria bacterium RIFCSPHIGHO2_12_FULL_41_9]OGN24470.1 MAG: hypothetical protein A2916_02455 [Candidatus Yanofskybacteria bacterium RIFCSPLOWO2_01_FULL_41_67]OGN29536.1 MAG: hypothetical protein A3H54_01365 
MADHVEKDSYFQRLLKSYLDYRPGSERELADEFRTAVGTITRWANGHSRPAQKAEQAIVSALQEKIYRELQDTLINHLMDNNDHLTVDFASELASEFEVAKSTVRRWANGTARPHPRLALMIIGYVKNRETK